MKYAINPARNRCHGRGIGHVTDNNFGARRSIFPFAGREIIENADATSVRIQRVGQMLPDKAAAPGYQIESHACPLIAP